MNVKSTSKKFVASIIETEYDDVEYTIKPIRRRPKRDPDFEISKEEKLYFRYKVWFEEGIMQEIANHERHPATLIHIAECPFSGALLGIDDDERCDPQVIQIFRIQKAYTKWKQDKAFEEQVLK